MMLPNSHKAQVERAKITHYLLSEKHDKGGPKSAFFVHFGFTTEKWQTLADALRSIGASNPACKSFATPHGTVFVVEGILPCPDGRAPWVRTVWMADAHWRPPRLVTAYPLRPPSVRELEIAMIEEHSRVVLTEDVPAEKLVAGDVGVVVHVHAGGQAYLVEFMTYDGQTVAVIPLEASQVRPIAEGDLTHARKVA